MSELKAKIWVDALIRRAESSFAAAYVVRRGDETAGSVLVKVANCRGEAELFVPARDASGARVWTRYRPEPVPEADIDAYCARRSEDDPDLWLIEIEDKDMRHFLVESVEER